MDLHVIPHSGATHLFGQVGAPGNVAADRNIETTWVLKTTANPTAVIKDMTDAGLSVVQRDARHLKVKGCYSAYCKAMGCNVDVRHQVWPRGQLSTHHVLGSEIQMKKAWATHVEHVIGFDTTTKRCRHHHKRSLVRSRLSTVFTPLQLSVLYNFPSGDGTGQKIGIIELGGGYNLSDINLYFSRLGLNYTPNITDVLVDGATNDVSDFDASGEVILDAEIVMSIAPGAATRMYFAPNTDMGFYDAIHQAILDGCNIVSISWGGPETFWDQATMNSFNALFQSAPTVSIFIAAGDNGSSDGTAGLNVDFPGSAPYATSCGGTSITANGNTIANEVVWNNSAPTSATGGGVSAVFATPSYQTRITTFALGGKRGVPDVCADADPSTGYFIIQNGQQVTFGGTSAVAPLYAGLVARLNQASGTPLGFANPLFYNNESAFRDITSGNNGGYSATVGWDPCSGLGSPNGRSLASAIHPSPPAPTPPAPTPPTPSPPAPTPPSPTVVAAFTESIVSGQVPLVVNFTDESTGSPTSWLWHFGDTISSTSATKNPTHTYTTPGQYTVSLTVSNGNATNTVTHTNLISVVAVPAPPPPAGFKMVNFSANNIAGEAPFVVKFTDKTSPSPIRWAWNFGDGTPISMEKNPMHTYVNQGRYTVSLTVTGPTSSQTITKNNYITVDRLESSFIASPTTATRGHSVQFTDLSTGTPTSWKWYFGDGQESAAQNPQHTYTKPGSYTVILRVANKFKQALLTKKTYIVVV